MGVAEGTPLHHATSRGFPEIARRLIEAGAELDAIDRSLGTPLHDAVAQGHVELVELLLDAGANANICNISGQAPLDIAAHATANRKIAGLLKEHGARPSGMFLRLVKELKRVKRH